MHFRNYCKRIEATIVKRQKYRGNDGVDSLELHLREVKLDDSKSDEVSSSDIVGMVKQEFTCQPFIMIGVAKFSCKKIDISSSENSPPCNEVKTPP